MKKYKVLFADMHSNPHHSQVDELDKWLKQAKQLFDFWPIAYYPYYVRQDKTGIWLEDLYDEEIVKADFQKVKEICDLANKDNYPMFMGYEWQGSGEDGDHNVFFLDNNQQPSFPLRYEELLKHYANKQVLAIPHHTAYSLGNRGKNWSTHNEQFSPFSEIYSSHGSSESDETSVPMDRHIHMGPRCDSGSYNNALRQGIKVGCIASGDNHFVPGVYGFGLAAVLSKSNSKEDIWEALKNSRVYGVSKDKIILNYTIDNHELGETINESTNSKMLIEAIGSNAIDRVEVIDKDKVILMLPHTSTYEDEKNEEYVKFKFKLEFGWGPDRKVFPDIESKVWNGFLQTKGKILSVEKCWSNFGQNINYQDDSKIDFTLKTFKSTASGKWMGPSAVTTEAFIFEIEDNINNSLLLKVDEKEYELKIKDILDGSYLIPLIDESKKLIKERFNFDGYYRSDPIWHNAYKIKVNKGFKEIAYTFKKEISIDTSKYDALRVKVYELNGSIAYSSPIYINHKKA